MDHVYVLDMQGRPLMSCRPRKARLLLKANRAHISKYTLFTIQLDDLAGLSHKRIVLLQHANSYIIERKKNVVPPHS